MVFEPFDLEVLADEIDVGDRLTVEDADHGWLLCQVERLYPKISEKIYNDNGHMSRDAIRTDSWKIWYNTFIWIEKKGT
jgi:hypothetical protein